MSVRFGSTRTMSYYGPNTKIRRQGMAQYKNLMMRKFLKSAVVYLVLLFVFCLGYVWVRVKVVEKGYHLSQLEATKGQMKEENRALTVEAAMLRSPQRLEEMSKQMGLRRPDEDQIVFIQK